MIDNPYKVLGLNEGASDDEVKAAYKRLAKQYHPDVNQSPYAEARMKEINEAYTQIMKGDKGRGGSYAGGYGYSQNYQGQEESSRMTAARNYISSAHYREALNVLNSIPAGERNARWYYYCACANSGLGNRTEAVDHAQQAVNMEPDNYEYRRLLEQLQYGSTQYQQFGRNFQMPNLDLSKICLCGSWICVPYCLSTCFPYWCCFFPC